MIKTIDDEITWARQWVEGNLEEIAKIPVKTYRNILFLSVVDAIVQHQENVNSHSNQKEFASFLLKYSKEYHEILAAYCPTTMYYDNLPLLTNERLHLDEDELYFTDQQTVNLESERLLSILSQFPEAKIERHRYASLIYAMRNKLVHEMYQVGCEASFLTEDSDPIPHLVLLDKHNHEELSPYKWTLMIPEKFIWVVGKSAITNYLDECQKMQKHPLTNMETFRKSRFAWYD